MNQLPSPFYAWFPVSKRDYIPVYYNLNFACHVYANQIFLNINQLYTNSDQYNPIDRNLLARDLWKNDHQCYTSSLEVFNKNLRQLHVTPLGREEVFYPAAKRLGLPPIDEVWLPSERFFWDYPQYNLGSSRHILLGSIQLKGSGRNPMATRVDYVHSWGGQYLWQNLKALAFARTFQSAFPLGVLETFGFSLESSELSASKEVDATLNSVLFREAKSYRLTQVRTGFDPLQIPSKEKVKSDFVHELELAETHFPQSFHFQFATMLCLGINDLNITKENLMISGAIIDYEDIDFLGDKNEQSLLITLVDPAGSRLTTDSSLDELSAETRLFTSNLHVYLEGIRISIQTIEHLLDLPQSSKEKVELDFLGMLRKVNSEMFENDSSFLPFIELLMKYQGNYIEGIHYQQLNGDNTFSLIPHIKNLKHEIRRVSPATQDYTTIEVMVTFPRGKWRERKVQTYYDHIDQRSISKKCANLLKLLRVKFSSGNDSSIQECMGFSSLADKFLASEAWITPYKFSQNKIEFKHREFKQVKAELLPNLKFENSAIISYSGVGLVQNQWHDMTLNELDLLAHLEQGEFILRGYIMKIESIENHFVAIAPVWLSK